MPTAHPRRPPTGRPIAALLCAAALNFGAPAQAAGSCDEMKALASSGLDLSIILETLNELRPSLTPDELACVEGAGLRVEIVDALRPYVREPETRPQEVEQTRPPVEGGAPVSTEGATHTEALSTERSPSRSTTTAVDRGPSTAVAFQLGEVSFRTTGTLARSFYVQDPSGNGFACGPRVTAGWLRRYWQSFADYLDMVADEAGAHPNADWGFARNQIVASSMVDYCNLRASTQGGAVFLSFIHNRACFGSAGCNTDGAGLVGTPAQVRELSAALRAYAP